MTRKLAAILVADMVGYSRLMAVDEAGTLARLKALRAELIGPETAARDGRIVKAMGDGLLVVFDSVVGAILAAAAVQKAMAREVFEYYTARAPDTVVSQARLACIHAELGDEARAKAAAETVLSLGPGFSAARFVDSSQMKQKAERDKFVAGLVKAGLPE